MYEMLYEKPVKLLILGAGCSFVSEATAQASYLWNLTQISYASVSPSLSDKRKYPRFVRVCAPDLIRNPTRIEILKYFNWSKVSTIDQSYEIFTAVTQDFVHLLSNSSENISVQRAELFTIDPRQQVMNLMKYDSRIILAGFYETEGRKIFCEAYKQGLYGPKHVWFIPGWLEDNWATAIDPTITCNRSQMAAVHEGNIVTKSVQSNPEEERGIAKLTANEFMKEFNRKLNNIKPFASHFAHQAYDSVWVAALALNRTIQTLIDKGISRRLEDFSYNDTEMADIILQNVKETTFLGVKGHIEFNQDGDPVGQVVVAQVQNGVNEIVGTWLAGRNSDKITWLTNPPMKWPGGHVPLDSMKQDEIDLHVRTTLYIAMCTLSSIGIILAFGFLLINVLARDKRIIKMSSPNLNNIILIGCIVMYLSVFCTDLTHQYAGNICKIRAILLSCGFSLAFGALFSKTWRVHRIFLNAKLERRVLRDYQLVGFVIAMLFIDAVVLVMWNVISPMTSQARYHRYTKVNDDVMITDRYYVCTSRYNDYFLGVVYSIKGILLMFGGFLAWETRKVNIEHLNDSKNIGMCIYNAIVISTVAVAMGYTLERQVELLYAVTSVATILATTLTQCIIFIPKVMYITSRKIKQSPSLEDNQTPDAGKDDGTGAKKEAVVNSPHTTKGHTGLTALA